MPEVVLYHKYVSPNKTIFSKFARLFTVVGVILVLISYSPSIWFWIQTEVTNQTANFQLSPSEVKILTVIGETGQRKYIPPFDSRLPVINHLAISSIGVDTTVQEATYDNYEEALRRGVWRVSDFGVPNETGNPVIFAAHRFGYLAWTNSFRHKNSFFNLPKVQTGDTIQVVWRQRKYTYEVYKVDKAREITDYTADLILYTCETLSGPERIFVYARMIQI
ncbi:MAG: hypothetical protein UU16_C0040G0002 [Candidatus Woesebacteria bacterium GW2011_GWA2_40_7]|uniref:Sortase family protein n=2 Tax=Candidatus Woeseibacteriota TaxID=1752722 RepID=A0A0G0P0J3_9BACT|nr:MAG: hypothetical protein UT17_C0005G0032 [Candidatus Woesebacteria bacterium GW2011_GWB1_39_10]KKR72414.1 MAG: hypothetical protein UU16_C0040G0002 [Candidatus Woesebacteria bacterium GW2011_GWA2_40_7]